MSTEEHGIIKNLKPMAWNAKEVIEPVSFVRAGTFVVQTAESIIVCLDPCNSRINTESEAGSCTKDSENEIFETIKLAPQYPSIKDDGLAEISVENKKTDEKIKRIEELLTSLKTRQ